MISSKIPLRKKIALELFRKYRKNTTQLHPLDYIFWECTLRCNLSCLHCGSDFLEVCYLLINGELPNAKEKKDFDEQGNIGVAPVPIQQEKPTFYYHNPYVNTDVEISGASECAQDGILNKLVEKATAKFTFKFTELPGKFSASIGINLCGNIWLLNNHAIKYDIGT